jgi:hypothetical protein
MIISSRNNPTKELTFQYTDEEWATLVWINTHRTEAWFLSWLEVEWAKMDRRKAEQLQSDRKRLWMTATPAIQQQIDTLLGVT